MAQLSNLTMLEGRPVVAKYNTLVQATTGVLSLDVAGAADVTLTNNQAAYYLIVLTGVLTGDILLKVPQREKPYLVFNNTSGAFTVGAQPVTSGAGIDLVQGYFAPFICDGVDVFPVGPQNTPGGIMLQEAYTTAVAGPRLTGRRARGTAASPEVVQSGDATRGILGQGWARNAGDTAEGWQNVGQMRMLVDSVDPENRVGGMIEWNVSPGVSAAMVARMRLRQSGELILGNPVTSTDSVTLRQVDIEGVAGESGLQIIDETGVITSIGKGVLARCIVEATTAGSGAPNEILESESGKTFTNQGATARNYHQLPPAVAGLWYEFICQDADGMRVTASAGDTIRIGASVSATGGRIDSTAIGDVVLLKAINTTEWIATRPPVGTWTVT